MEKGVVQINQAVKYLIGIFDKWSVFGVPVYLPLRFTFEIGGKLQGKVSLLLEGSSFLLEFLVHEFEYLVNFFLERGFVDR